MTRKLKTLGMALVAALAIGAVTAPAAFAEAFDFHSDTLDTSLTGGQVNPHQFGVDGGEGECETVTYAGTVSDAEVSEVTVTPTFTECSVSPLGTAHISMNGCKFIIKALTKESSTYKAQLDISCETGKSMKMEATVFGTTKCTVHFPSQTLNGVTVSEASGGDITVDAEIGSIEYNQTAGTGLGACSNAIGTTNGTYEGHATVNGGEAELALSPVPQRAVILTDPVVLKGQGSKAMFEVESKDKVQLQILAFQTLPGYLKFLQINKGCLDNISGTHILKNEKDKCKEEVECNKELGKDNEFSVNTRPIGADVVVVKGC